MQIHDGGGGCRELVIVSVMVVVLVVADVDVMVWALVDIEVYQCSVIIANRTPTAWISVLSAGQSGLRWFIGGNRLICDACCVWSI